LAIFGVCKAWEEAEMNKLTRAGQPAVLATKRHLITSAIEHHAVLYAFQQLEKMGYDVTYLPVDPDGIVRLEDVRSALRDDTLLVSIMYANNEIGTIQPIQEIAEVCKEKKVYFHTDACQAAGALSLDVQELGINLMTINASKIYGPKGVGLLYIKQGTRIKPLIYGGGQEKNIRSGTENIPGIIGFAKALELITAEQKAENARLTKLRDYFITQIMERLPKVRLNGHPTKRLPNNINVSILDLEGEAFILYMDNYGVACATGSACDSATLDPSHVILALGVPYEFAHSSIRFTLGKRTSKTDLEYTIKHLVPVVEKLRKISPVHVELDSTVMAAPEAFAGQALPHWQRDEKLNMKN
jgi:cysteine desulfurase